LKKQAAVYRTRFRMLVEAQLEMLNNEDWDGLVARFDEEEEQQQEQIEEKA
ncbi:MAG: septum formation initiator, partial [Anaerobacillus sp.]